MVEVADLLDANASRILNHLATRLMQVVPGRPETYPRYKQVHDALGLEFAGSTYGTSLESQGLDSLARWALARSLPAVTGVVIDGTSFRPGPRFYHLHDKEPDDFAWWTAEVARSKSIDWASFLTSETPDDAQDHTAVQTAPAHASNGSVHRDPRLQLDAEFEDFLAGFLRRDSWYWLDWLPHYSDTVEAVRASIESGDLDVAVELLWRTLDNGVANAGSGVVGFDAIDRVSMELKAIVATIAADASVETYRRVFGQLLNLREQGKLPKHPALLIARAFATIAPHEYHTTADSKSHNKVISWVEKHSAFRASVTDSWAERASALTQFLSLIDELKESVLIRNMFPWFVYQQIYRDPSGRPLFVPGFIQRKAEAVANASAETRQVKLRHNVLSGLLYQMMVKSYGKDAVGIDQRSGRGGWVDAIVRPSGDEVWLYEIKIARTASSAIRQALGQLFEYGFHKGGWDPSKLFVVAEPELDRETADYLARLRERFGIQIEYLRVTE